jgi:8-oxo-dGTP pyrophosphatase MutT (NUDIX family)
MPNDKIKNPWITLSKKAVYDNPWISLEEHEVINPAGGKGIYGKVHFKNIAIGIVALDKENNTWLVGQHRYTLNEWSWEIPEGGGPLEKNILESAQRELKEETGLVAERWTEILKTHLSNSVSDEVGYIFLAEELKEGKNEPEETEADMKVWKLPFSEALEMVLAGKITDGLSVMGILKVARMKDWK